MTETILTDTLHTDLRKMQKQLEATSGRVEAFLAGNLPLPIPVVTALPETAVTGQLVDYIADVTAGYRWRFVYNGDSTSLFKWECVGGSPLYAEVSAFQSKAAATGGTFGDLATLGPDLTAPLAGDYLLEVGAHTHTTNAAGAIIRLGLSIGGGAAFDVAYTGFSASTQWGPVLRGPTPFTLMDATLVRAKYKADTNVQTDWERRYMRLTPVRCR